MGAGKPRMAEFERLDRIMRQFCGKRLLRTAWSYGDELLIEVLSGSELRSGRDAQEWTVATRASRWLLLSATGLVAHDRDPKDPKLTAFQELEGTTVRSAEVRPEDYALTLTFDNNYRFVILTNKRRRLRLPDLALWRLYTPDQTIDVQPNGDIDFVPADVVDDVAYRRRMREP